MLLLFVVIALAVVKIRVSVPIPKPTVWYCSFVGRTFIVRILKDVWDPGTCAPYEPRGQPGQYDRCSLMTDEGSYFAYY